MTKFPLFKLPPIPYLVYGIIGFISIWYWHPDEHYQITEFASFKLGITDEFNLVWEYTQKMRSGILPLVTYAISKLMTFLNLFHPFLIESITRIFASILFVYALKKLMTFFSIENLKDKKSFYYLTCFFWLLPMTMVRFSSESISTSLFWLGFCLFDFRQEIIKHKKLIIIGLLWGLSFHIRMHLAILIGVTILWVGLNKGQRKFDFLYLFYGFLLSILCELFANYWLYGSIVWAPFLYFKLNILEGVASKFGTAPFYYYLVELFWNLFPILSISIFYGIYVFFRTYPIHIYTLLILSYLLIHSVIPHKEFRFIFPILPLIVLVGFESLFKKLKQSRLIFKLIKALVMINFLLFSSNFIIQSFKPVNLFNLYPYTQKYNIIHYSDHNPYALIHDTSNHMRANFYKNKSCQVVKLSDKMESSPHIVTSEKDLGSSLEINRNLYVLRYQTIPKTIIKHIPKDIEATIEKLYIYEKTAI